MSLLRFFVPVPEMFVVVGEPNSMRIQGAVWLVASILLIAGEGSFLAIDSEAQSKEQVKEQEQRAAYITLSSEAGSTSTRTASTSTLTRTVLSSWHTTVPPGYSSTVQGVCDDRNRRVITFVISWSSEDDGEAHHQHSNGGRPSANVSPATATVPCDNSDHPIGLLTYPEVAGVVTIQCSADAKPCVKGDFDVSTFVVDVKAPGLIQLPASPHIVPIGISAIAEVMKTTPPHNHPDNHWGQPELIDKTLALAERYDHERHQKLYVNDMSLPWGGILDFRDTWSPPFETHRDGRHVDVRRVSMSEADRTAFRRLAESADLFGPGHVCVDGGDTAGHWHLSIETTCQDMPLSGFGLTDNEMDVKHFPVEEGKNKK
jgi:Penicillin-insensitive murein endopeptidase